MNKCISLKKLPKFLSLGSFLFASTLICACNNEDVSTSMPISTSTIVEETIDYAEAFKTVPQYHGEDVLVSKIGQTDSGRTYLEVEGKPFPYLGTQIRTDALRNCDNYSWEYIETIFQSAKELGVTSLQVPVEWTDLENVKDVWVWDELDALLGLAVRNDIKIELLWFGTNMCGETHSYSTPNYILEDGVTYTKLDASRIGEFWSYYGMMWFLDYTDQDLIDREKNAVSKMMEHIYNWDSTHGGHKPVIGIQVLNETDIFIRWRNSQKEIYWPSGEKLTSEQGWAMVNNMLNELGKTVHQAKYKVYTRTNCASLSGSDTVNTAGTPIWNGTQLNDLPQWTKDFFNLEGIDIVGDDLYQSSVKNVSGMIRLLNNKLPGNFGHLAENAGDYKNQAYIVLAAIASGGGLSIYDYCTPPFYIRHRSSDGVDQGITYIDEDTMQIVKRDQWAETQVIMNAIKNSGNDILTTDPENIAAFNVKGNYPTATTSQTISTNKVNFNFQTTDNAYGFAFHDKEANYVTIFTSGEAKITLSNVTLGTAEAGKYVDGTWVKESEKTLTSGALNTDGTSIYRIKVTEVLNDLTSNTLSFIG